MAAKGHALLSPSSAHRWLNCTPSARLEEHVEDKSSEFAEEGSCAHALCEEKLWTLLGEEYYPFAAQAREEQESANRERWHSNEMENCADEYAAIVWNKYQEALKQTSYAKLFIEREFNLEKYIQESKGTTDAIVIANGTMEVIDFKYGKGKEVSSVENEQMMIYAIGALEEFEIEYNISNVRMTIVQPRIQNYSEFEMSVEDLAKWRDEFLVPRARKAWDGEGEEKPGKWCTFCKIKAKCAKLANQAIAAYTQHEAKETISDEDYPAILSLIPAIKSWCSAVEDYATAKAIDGKHFKGYKLVEGRSIRKISNEQELVDKLLSAGYEDVYKKPELKTISELEKQIGKKEFYTIASEFIIKPKGKPTLVPESDKRQEINTSSAAEDFAGIQVM